jgi:hypothetical protein
VQDRQTSHHQVKESGCSGRISTHEPGVEEALRGIVGGDGAAEEVVETGEV